MVKNVCGRERRTRGVVGVLLMIVAFIIGQVIGWIVGIAGVILLLTAIFSYCPINSIANRNSCSRPLIKDPFRNREIRDVKY